MAKIAFPRRTFLKGIGGLGLSLPLMSSLSCSRDQQKVMEKVAAQRLADNGFPKRFLAVYTPNGNYDRPTADLAGEWSALQPHKAKINVVAGMSQSVCNVPPGEPHQTGMA